PQFASLKGDFWQAVTFATGHSDIERRTDTPLWLAASFYRTPVQPATLFSLGEGHIWTHQTDLDFVRCLGSYFPATRNQFVPSGIQHIGSAIDWFQQPERCLRAYIEVMLDPAFIFDRDAHHALAASLILPDPECAGIARDILIQLIESSRLSVDQLGNEI